MKGKGFFVYGVDDVLLSFSESEMNKGHRPRSAFQSSSAASASASASKKQLHSDKKTSSKKHK